MSEKYLHMYNCNQTIWQASKSDGHLSFRIDIINTRQLNIYGSELMDLNFQWLEVAADQHDFVEKYWFRVLLQLMVAL